MDPLDLNTNNPIEDNSGKIEDKTTTKGSWFNNPLALYGTIAALAILLTLLVFSLIKGDIGMADQILSRIDLLVWDRCYA